ncbi:hypothetical protein GW17_00050452 [Ensete ventricosum]|nr:hypothetical protein GW17_00050452 [Ensete ventricosum]
MEQCPKGLKQEKGNLATNQVISRPKTTLIGIDTKNKELMAVKLRLRNDRVGDIIILKQHRHGRDRYWNRTQWHKKELKFEANRCAGGISISKYAVLHSTSTVLERTLTLYSQLDSDCIGTCSFGIPLSR